MIKDTELIKLNAKKLRIKGEFDKLQYQNELNQRSKMTKFLDGALEVWGLPRALLATGELSFMLIQGGLYSIGNPRLARHSFVKAMGAFANENKSKQHLKYIQAQEFYPRMKASKLALTEPDAKLEAREEQFLGGWVNYIWDVAGYPIKFANEKLYEGWKKLNPIRAVERAGVSYLNMLRVQKYLQGEEMLMAQGKTFETHPQDYKNLADVINTFTGRASLGKGEQVSKGLSAIFFSPRNWASMVKTATPYGIYHFGKMGSKSEGEGTMSLLARGKVKPSVAQKMAINDYMKFVGITASIVAMAAVSLNDDDDDETGVSLDPLSSDFLKIKIGNTRIDPWGGRIQQVILVNRIMSSLIGREGKSLEYAGRMVQNKFNPSASMAFKYISAKEREEDGVLLDKFGNPISIQDDLWNSVRPIYWQSFKEIHKEQPMTTALLLDAYGLFGGGTQTYKTPTEIMKSKKVSYDDLEKPEVVLFKNIVKKSEESYSNIEQEELTAQYAKGVKDLERQKEKGLIKDVKSYLPTLEDSVISEFDKSRNTETKDELLSNELSKMKLNLDKANRIVEEFTSYDEKNGVMLPSKTISQQENRLKRLVKSGIIDKEVEKEVIRLMVDVNEDNQP